MDLGNSPQNFPGDFKGGRQQSMYLLNNSLITWWNPSPRLTSSNYDKGRGVFETGRAAQAKQRPLICIYHIDRYAYINKYTHLYMCVFNLCMFKFIDMCMCVCVYLKTALSSTTLQPFSWYGTMRNANALIGGIYEIIMRINYGPCEDNFFFSEKFSQVH